MLVILQVSSDASAFLHRAERPRPHPPAPRSRVENRTAYTDIRTSPAFPRAGLSTTSRREGTAQGTRVRGTCHGGVGRRLILVGGGSVERAGAVDNGSVW